MITNIIKSRLFILIICSSTILGASAFVFLPKKAKKPNVLFIAIDDLRPELGAYGHPIIQSPNLDKFSEEATVFEKAYCQYALCAPSRSSLLSGYRPDATGLYDVNKFGKDKARKVMNESYSLPQHFFEHGYNTLRVGKIFHTDDTQDKDAWTEQRKPGGGRQYANEETLQKIKVARLKAKAEGLTGWKYNQSLQRPSTENADAPDEKYIDYNIANKALSFIDDYSDKKKPFFLAVGFIKPHLPFVAPKKYWDLYKRSDFKVPPKKVPAGVSEYALVESWNEMRLYKDIQNHGDLKDPKALRLIHGYAACVSFIDDQVGRVLKKLEEKGLSENTIVVIWGDHGWKLGDYGDWSKYTNMEIDTRVPLIVKVPGKTKGEHTDALVELMDLYPTLAELCGLKTPRHVQGTSFAPVLDDPDREWKLGALSQMARGKKQEIMGYSLRTKDWRYTEWVDSETKEVYEREFYNHEDSHIAKKNEALNPEYATLVEEHAALLKKGWEGLVPTELIK